MDWNLTYTKKNEDEAVHTCSPFILHVVIQYSTVMQLCKC